MGKSKSIAEMESQEDEYRAYLAKSESQLEVKTEKSEAVSQKKMHDFYEENGHSYSEFLSGRNSGFIQ